MDPQHRQELEQNDLAAFLTNFREWWIQHGLKTLLMILVVVLALSLWKTYQNRQVTQRNERWLELSQATSPDAYRALSRLYDQPGYTAIAHLRAADLAMSKVVGGDNPLAVYGIADEQEQVTDEQKVEMLDTAEEDYNAVLKMPSADKILKLNAMLGLAAVHETRQQWDEAREMYTQTIETAGDAYGTIAATARARRNALDRAQVPVSFAPEPPQPPQPQQGGQPGEPSAGDVPLIPAQPPAADDQPPAESGSGDGG